METYIIKRQDIRFEVERQTSTYCDNRVTARLDNESAIGKIPGLPNRAYPRIEFLWKTQPWLHERADSSGWIVDDYETDEDLKNRLPDTCTFNLTAEEAQAITNWRLPAPQEPQKPQTQPAQAEYVEPIFGIGCLNVGDGAEVQMPWPKLGRVCSRCGAAESDGAMFTTLGGNICDDCA